MRDQIFCVPLLLTEANIFFSSKNSFHNTESYAHASDVMELIKIVNKTHIHMARLGGNSAHRIKLKKAIATLKTVLESDYTHAKHLHPIEYGNAVENLLEYYGRHHTDSIMVSVTAIWKSICDKAFVHSNNVKDMRTITPIFGDVLEAAESLSYRKVLDTINVNEVMPHDFIETQDFYKGFLLNKYKKAIEMSLAQ